MHSIRRVPIRKLIALLNAPIRRFLKNPQCLIEHTLRWPLATLSPVIVLKVSQLLSNSKVDKLIQRDAFFL